MSKQRYRRPDPKRRVSEQSVGLYLALTGNWEPNKNDYRQAKYKLDREFEKVHRMKDIVHTVKAAAEEMHEKLRAAGAQPQRVDPNQSGPIYVTSFREGSSHSEEAYVDMHVRVYLPRGR